MLADMHVKVFVQVLAEVKVRIMVIMMVNFVVLVSLGGFDGREMIVGDDVALNGMVVVNEVIIRQIVELVVGISVIGMVRDVMMVGAVDVELGVGGMVVVVDEVIIRQIEELMVTSSVIGMVHEVMMSMSKVEMGIFETFHRLLVELDGGGHVDGGERYAQD